MTSKEGVILFVLDSPQLYSNYTYIYYICLFIYSGKVELYGGLFPVYDVQSDPTEVLDVLLNTDCSSDVICH